ncbi:5'-nucleotidase /3'-nucleotidase /exopolyphosphatase [Caloramator fervidus]|uniref:5'-nucleotidase SurE n=1 Tax=Caloramator fervidus TaxID=29344 RepID=A0A1H5UMK7_9CLOT|nr:5'/3'-nucleotidase SurE [Caloramator fervidus]SEF76236.1 5'-nucleotidase /3'-nucleotidase /exopolyphosphatase [Caloramator fervidus]
MRILISNDDGIYAKGIYYLAKELEKDHECIIVAPDKQRSAAGHAITLHRPITVKKVKLEGIKSIAYSVDGKPADCVKVAIEKLLEDKIDMIISGINNGFNLGTDVIYSGTVSAAVEGAIYKIPSIAVSVDFNADDEYYKRAARHVKKIAETSYSKLKNDVVLNINVPKEDIKGIKVCSLGNRIYVNAYIEEETGNEGERKFQLAGEVKDFDDVDTDVFYIKNGYITVTPLHYDLTNFNIINEVNLWLTKEVIL